MTYFQIKGNLHLSSLAVAGIQLNWSSDASEKEHHSRREAIFIFRVKIIEDNLHG